MEVIEQVNISKISILLVLILFFEKMELRLEYQSMIEYNFVFGRHFVHPFNLKLAQFQQEKSLYVTINLWLLFKVWLGT